MRDTASVSVPATTANLGPGFDSFGLALALRNRFTATPAEEWSVEVRGEGAGVLSAGPDNRVARAVARVFAEAGAASKAAAIECENAIPPGAGLGSSAAAVVGGILLGDALCNAGLDKEDVLALATEFEGHPDNAAAALHGGFTVCWDDDDVRCVRIEPAAGLAVVVVGAGSPLLTESSRGLLPTTVPHGDAAFSAGRAGLLAVGIALGDEVALAAGLTDRIHEPYRAAAIPDLEKVRAVLLAAGATGAVLSGAGPTVVGLVHGADDSEALERAHAVADVSRAGILALAGRLEPRVLDIERSGAFVLQG